MSDQPLEFVAPLPFFPPKSTSALMEHFDDEVYKKDKGSHLYKFLEALTGSSGAGDVKKQNLIARLGGAVETTYFLDLDHIFGTLFAIPRLQEEEYDYNPYSDILTSEEWDEVTVKDAWYRARAVDFLAACHAGGTEEGFELMVRSVLGVSCDVYELWKYHNHPTIPGQLGRTQHQLLNEVVITPHKVEMGGAEVRTLLHFLDRIRPVDTVVTIDLNGLAVHKMVDILQVASDSSYFEVQKEVIGTPDLSKIEPPEYLLGDIFDGSDWLHPEYPSEAPTSAFNTTQEYSSYYGWDGGEGVVEGVSYFKESEAGVLTPEENYTETVQGEKWTRWEEMGRGDSPDNYPGGKQGQTPEAEPALTQSGDPYIFPFESQAEYLESMTKFVESQGGEVSGERYRLPSRFAKKTQISFHPLSSLPGTKPVSSTFVTTSWFSGRESRTVSERDS